VKYCDLRPAFAAFREGRNVTATLRELLGEPNNTPEIIDIAYDLQAGTYIEEFKKNPAQSRAYASQLSEMLMAYVEPGDRMLDVGTGEMTIFTDVANDCSGCVLDHYAMDISWSRMQVGRKFVVPTMRADVAARLQYFVGDLFHLPLRSKSIDVVWTSHAMEPNGGREQEALAELLRVARKWVVLFEPSYEKNSPEGQARMARLGYIKGLPDAITAAGGTLQAFEPIGAQTNPLNPTYAYVITPPRGNLAERPSLEWACPATGLAMERKADCFWSDGSKLAYPIIGGIPVLRAEAAVLATVLAD
jgi:uncharacterized protein YbaR (Trm112 family)